jgi:hypothetical protein
MPKYLIRKHRRKYSLVGLVEKETEKSIFYKRRGWKGDYDPTPSRMMRRDSYRIIECPDPVRAVNAYNVIVDEAQAAIDELELEVLRLKNEAERMASECMQAEVEMQLAGEPNDPAA